MNNLTIKRIFAGLLFGAAITLLLVNQSTVNANKTSGEAQGDKNPFVAALEKQIAGQENKPAEEVFKNIQLLKGMPANRFLRVMQVGFSASLGVDCTHCHVADQWEKDDKEAKQTARKMWTFVAKVNQDLKQAIGKGTVNCTTCHRGQVKPATSMPAPK
ncbi:MAG: photosynthetic reaction center cytochrome c subunit family protein [Acidobacteria bacterium]|nr:photosynthetic reaction center cytochrome c subunit family protein [Acidobacteriota bacterium]